MEIGQFDYNGFDYKGIGLKAALRNNDLTGRISASNEALQLGLDLSGLSDERFPTGPYQRSYRQLPICTG